MGIIQTILPWIQIALSVLLTITILLQRTSASLGSTMGGTEGNTVHNTRRGFEKVLFIMSIVLAVLFASSALLAIIL